MVPRQPSISSGVQHALGHHVPPEVLEFQAGPPALRPPEIAGALEHALRVILEDQQDAGQVGCELMEGHRPIDVAFWPFERQTILSSGTCSMIVASQVRCDQKT